MTNRIQAIVEKSSTDIVKYPVISAVVSRDGSRAIDTAELVLAGGAKVALNDIVSYIQDDAPLTDNVAVWNFQGSYRDESGFHHDGTRALPTNPDEGFCIPNDNGGNTLKYRTNYGLKFTAVGQEVTVVDKNMSSHKTDASLDFREQFDIIINFKCQTTPTLGSHYNGTSNTHMILFSKYDTTNDRGVMIGLKRIGSGTSRKWVVYAKLDDTEFTGDGTLQGIDTDLGKIEHGDDKATRMIRFYRDHDNKVKITLDNAQDGTNCTQTIAENTNARVTAPLYFGTSNENVEGTTTNNFDFHGHIFQIRVYCGGYLQNDHVEALFSAGAQQMTQKVSGVCWAREDKLDKIKISTKSRSKSLLDAMITNERISNNITSGNTTANEPATHIKNVFDGGQDVSDVLKTIVYHLDPNFVFFRHTSTDSDNAMHADAKYCADGAFIKNVEILMIMARNGFLTFPTKTFLWEYGAHEYSNMNSGYTFSDSEYQLFDRGENDLKIINDLELFGDIQHGYYQTNFGNLNGVTENQVLTTKFAFPPLNVVLRLGTASEFSNNRNDRIPSQNYWVDFNSKELTISDKTWSQDSTNGGVDDFIWATYNFEITDDTPSQMGDDKTIRHDRREDSTSVAKYGRRSARWYVPQLLSQDVFQSLAQQIIAEFKDEKRRYRIKAPFLVNCLRENLHVTLSSSNMKFTNNAGTAEDQSTKLLPIKSIKWEYPECVTTIEVGDYDYDLYDIMKGTADTTTSTVGSLIKSRS